MEIVVYDTNIIKELHNMHLLSTMEKSGWQIHITGLALNELKRPVRGSILTSLPCLHVYEYNHIDQYIALQNYMDRIAQKGNLSMADCSMLLLAKEKYAILCSNDRKMRTVARNEGIQVRGTIGVVLLLLEHNRIDADQAITAVQTLQTTNPQIGNDLIEEAIRRIEEIKGGEKLDIF